MSNANTPNLEGLSEAEQALIAAYRAKDLIELAKLSKAGGLIPDGLEEQMPFSDTLIKQARKKDIFSASETLAFFVAARLVSDLWIQRSALFDGNMTNLILSISEALDEATPYHVFDLADFRSKHFPGE